MNGALKAGFIRRRYGARALMPAWNSAIRARVQYTDFTRQISLAIYLSLSRYRSLRHVPAIDGHRMPSNE